MQKNRFEKFARIFSRRHKQTTFSDAVFLGALRVKTQHRVVNCTCSNFRKKYCKELRCLNTYSKFVCVEVLQPSQPNGVMSSAVSLPNYTFTGQA